jgi:riboflavin synthase
VFTGIVEIVGTIRRIEQLAAGRRVTVACPAALKDLEIGESVALDGACMTVVAAEAATFTVEVSAESLRRTTLGERRGGDRLNIERSMRLNERLGGHLVTGHVDGTGCIAAIRTEGESRVYTFDVGPELMRLMVDKGSVAVDGISLTCFDCGTDRFDVAAIAHTAAVTTLGAKQAGDRVNIENDLLAKYVEKLLAPRASRA